MALFGRRGDRSRRSAGEARYPDGSRMYCVGDIHGRADLLEELHGMIEEDARSFGGELHALYLGDYIDRGPDSRRVVDLLLAEPLEGFTHIFLKGNHEQALLDFLDYPLEAASWLTFGGRETLRSYGLTVPVPLGLPDLRDLADRLREVLPAAHREFFRDGRPAWQCGDYYFVHAGIRPGVALDRQHLDDQLWIRDEFTRSPADHGKVVVHGHTISTRPELEPNRIGIDTGAFHTGVLTCLVLEGSERRFLHTGRPPPDSP